MQPNLIPAKLGESFLLINIRPCGYGQASVSQGYEKLLHYILWNGLIFSPVILEKVFEIKMAKISNFSRNITKLKVADAVLILIFDFYRPFSVGVFFYFFILPFPTWP